MRRQTIESLLCAATNFANQSNKKVRLYKRARKKPVALNAVVVYARVLRVRDIKINQT